MSRIQFWLLILLGVLSSLNYNAITLLQEEVRKIEELSARLSRIENTLLTKAAAATEKTKP